MTEIPLPTKTEPEKCIIVFENNWLRVYGYTDIPEMLRDFKLTH